MVVAFLYVVGLIAFATFVYREEESSGAKLGIWIGIVLAFLVTLLWRPIGGGVMVAACFYVADRKNRSRMWALLGLFFGPIALLVLVALNKLEPGDSLSLGLSASAGAGGSSPDSKKH